MRRYLLKRAAFFVGLLMLAMPLLADTKYVTQSTQYTFFIRLVASSDHISGLTGMGGTSAYIVRLNSSAGTTAKAASTNTLTEIDSVNDPGVYTLTLTTTETGTLGFADVYVKTSTSDPSNTEIKIQAVNADDSVRAGLTALPNASAGASGGLPTGNSSGQVAVQYGTSAGQINLSGGNLAGAVPSVTGAVGSVTGAVGSVTAAISLSTADSFVNQSGTAQAGAFGSITLSSAASSTSALYIGQLVQLTGGTGAGQSSVVTSYNGGTKVATVYPSWNTPPDSTTTYAVKFNQLATVSGIAAAILSNPNNLLVTDGSGFVSVTPLYTDVMHGGQSTAGSASTITLQNTASSTNGIYVGSTVKIYAGTGAGQTRIITDYAGGTFVATVNRTWAINPDSTSKYAILSTSK